MGQFSNITEGAYIISEAPKKEEKEKVPTKTFWAEPREASDLIQQAEPIQEIKPSHDIGPFLKRIGPCQDSPVPDSHLKPNIIKPRLSPQFITLPFYIPQFIFTVHSFGLVGLCDFALNPVTKRLLPAKSETMSTPLKLLLDSFCM